MTKILILLFFPSITFAAPKFFCYSLPNTPVQVYEYASPQCLTPNKNDQGAKNQKLLGKNEEKSDDGRKDILCSYQAACKIAPDGPATEPDKELTMIEFQSQMLTGDLKGSILLCKGRGAVDSSGAISDADCPNPSRCQKDVLYNFGARSYSPATFVPAHVDPGAQ